MKRHSPSCGRSIGEALKKLKDIKTSLEFKTETHSQMKNHLKKLSKKKSSGLDGLSQENLILGTANLLAPLTAIVNQSILQGEFPSNWKQAAVTPVLKKGNPQLLKIYNISNYRVGRNLMVNRFKSLNNKIDYLWFNKTFNSFQIKFLF